MFNACHSIQPGLPMRRTLCMPLKLGSTLVLAATLAGCATWSALPLGDGAGASVGRGGRYDGLTGSFGRAEPAVGFVLNLDAFT